MKYKYEITYDDWDSDSDEHGWYSLNLSAVGNTLEELLDSAMYFKIDQDGGDCGDLKADDAAAQEYIEQAYKELIEKESNDVQT